MSESSATASSTNKLNAHFKKNNGIYRYVVSIYPGIAAGLLFFFRSEISASLSLQILYSVTLAIWSFLYFFYVINEGVLSSERNERLEMAIFRSPNPGIFYDCILFHQLMMDQLNLSNSDIRAYNKMFTSILESLCNLTNEFVNQKDSKVFYQANIMLYIPNCIYPTKVAKLRGDIDKCFHFSNHKSEDINGLLHLVPDLVFSKEHNHQIPAISLPILDQTQNAIADNIPGAPLAMVNGNHIVKNTRDATIYEQLSERERNIGLKYWETQVKNVKSFVSIAIPYHWSEKNRYPEILDKIGVINIDCSEINFLGTTSEFYTTYIALIFPIACHLSRYIAEYHQLFVESL